MNFGTNLCDDEWAPFATSVTTACVSAILCVITAPGNLLICWAIIKDPNNELKSSFNYLILNLAIADSFIGVVTEPVFVWYHTSEAMKYEVLGLRWLVYMSYFMTSTASVLSIAALATDRYLALTSTTIRKLSSSSAITVSIAIWIFSFTLSLFRDWVLYAGVRFCQYHNNSNSDSFSFLFCTYCKESKRSREKNAIGSWNGGAPSRAPQRKESNKKFPFYFGWFFCMQLSVLCHDIRH